ncbi:hypothetical protein RRG08_027826 [Elysia crispata]|uniref:Uncharacterized protein n=1 Tax=Elysia crispata TaxID=231223 RepID=A0AAE1EDF4_9GAST|nr:hypothetical protein RRG08_027826 [Elysia crispata]
MEPGGNGGQLSSTTCYRASTASTSSASSGCISQGSALPLGHVTSMVLSAAGPSSTTPLAAEAGGSGLARMGSSSSSLSARRNPPSEAAGGIGHGLNPSGAPLAASSSYSPSPSPSSSFMGSAEYSGGGGGGGGMTIPQQQPVRSRGPQHGCVSSILSSPALSLSIPGSSSSSSPGLASPYGMPSPTTTTGPHGQPQLVSPHHLSPSDGGPSGISTTTSTSSSSSSAPRGQQQQPQQHGFRDTSCLGECKD